MDIKAPERPRLDQTFNAGGAINDAHDVKVGATNGSIFAYVADGKNGLRVLDVISANDTPGRLRLQPAADAEAGGDVPHARRRRSPSRAAWTATARWTRRGNQIGVFGRRGARPFNGEEQRRMYLRDGKLFTVTDAPPGRPVGGRRRNRGSPAARPPPADARSAASY